MKAPNRISLLLVAFVALASISTLAFAGTGIGGKPNSSIGGGYTYGYAQGRVAYSYEPAPTLKAGDLVVVAKAKADLKLGDKVLATVGQGTQFTIVQVQGTWVGATIEQNGQKLSGWIASGDVASSPAPAPAVPTSR